MRVLITGGAGYVGTELVAALNNNPEVREIVVYDNLSRGNYHFFLGSHLEKSIKVKFVEGDILDSRKLKKALEGIDIVYHLAAKVTTPFANQTPHLFEQINNWGTAELVYAIEENPVKKLIYLSSSSVYGASLVEVNESTVPAPKTFYGISKLNAEEHVRRLLNKNEVETYILRCGNVYGFSRSMRFDAVINKFMFEAHFKGRITIHGDGKQHRSFIHVEHLSSILSDLSKNKNSLKPDIYNLVEDTWSINEIAFAIKDIYPELEMLYINQNLKLRELHVEKSNETLVPKEHSKENFKEILKEFKGAFSF